MLTCKETSELISARYDRTLGIGERLAMSMHVMMCRYCSAVARQIDLIQRLVGLKGEQDPSTASSACLSDAARDRISENVRKADSDSK